MSVKKYRDLYISAYKEYEKNHRPIGLKPKHRRL